MTSKDDLHGAKYNEVDSDAASIIEAALVHVPFDGWGQAALNAGAAIYTAGCAHSIQDGVEAAWDVMESGEAMHKLEALAELTQTLKGT